MLTERRRMGRGKLIYFSDSLWLSLSGADRRGSWNTSDPKYIYHYTNISGMKGIVESRNFWATDLRYLNDTGEPTYSLDCIRDFLISWKPRGRAMEKRRDVALRLFNGPLSQENRPGYVVCLSENADQLSQWRSY